MDTTFSEFKSQEYRPDMNNIAPLFKGEVMGYKVTISTYTANIVTVSIAGKINEKYIPGFELAIRCLPSVKAQQWIEFLTSLIETYITETSVNAPTYREFLQSKK